MPRTKEQFATIRSERKASILDAALSVFAEDGYHNASISKISKVAGVSKGLMYNYFESKEELLKILIGEYLDEENALVKELLLQPMNDDVFTRIVQLSAEILKKNPLRWKLYFDMSSQPEVLEIVKERYADVQALWYEKLLQFFTEKGSTDPMNDIQFFASTMMGLKVSYLYDPDHFPIDEMEQRIIKLFTK